MVLRDSFLASDKVKIVMLTCICPGMRQANHTLNSLRYAERLKEKAAYSNQKAHKIDPEKVQDDLNAFLEKHGALKTPRSENEEMAAQLGHGQFNDVFYNDDRIDDDMLDGQGMLENEMLLDDEMEDEIEMI